MAFENKDQASGAGFALGLLYGFGLPLIMFLLTGGFGHGSDFPTEFFFAPWILGPLVWAIAFAMKFRATKGAIKSLRVLLILYYISVLISLPFFSDGVRVLRSGLFYLALAVHLSVNVILWLSKPRRFQSDRFDQIEHFEKVA
jgi:hypothetical protein